jgi:hypothetical protein
MSGWLLRCRATWGRLEDEIPDGRRCPTRERPVTRQWAAGPVGCRVRLRVMHISYYLFERDRERISDPWHDACLMWRGPLHRRLTRVHVHTVPDDHQLNRISAVGMAYAFYFG